MNKKKLALIDGHSILNRAFYGVPDLTNGDGLHTNAIYGFLNIMFKLIEDEKPDYLIVAFDVNKPTFRHEMFDAYKGTRKPMLQELRQQVPVMKDLLKAMNIEVCELPGFEADDVIGTLSLKGENDGMEVVVLSGDRDLLQLASENVKIRIPKTKGGKTEVENYNAKEVMEKYLVTPKEFIDVKALMGDASDNIPGVPGIGEKTATKIIAEYKCIENAYEHVEDIKPNKAKLMLSEHYDQAVMSKQLATINRQSPVECNIQDGTINDIYNQEAFEFVKELEFKNLLARFTDVDTKNSCEDHFTVINDLNDAEAVFDKIEKDSVIGLSIIQDNNEIAGISLTAGEEMIYFIENGGFMTGEYLRDKFDNFLSNNTCCLIDLKEQLDFTNVDNVKNAFDLKVAAYLLNPLKNSYNVDDIARDYLSLSIKSLKEVSAKKTIMQMLSDDEREDVLKYLCYMSYVPYMAQKKIIDELKASDMYNLYNDVEMPLLFELYRMEKTGVKVEKNQLEEYSIYLAKNINETETEIFAETGVEFNINSPKQLGDVLFNKMGLEGGKKTKTGYSTSADVLEKMADEYPVVKKILNYRQLTKLKSTYADGLVNYISDDGRIHGKFNQTITATGRISSTEPNLQNIPIRMDLGKPIRRVFVPKDGFVFLDADYSQIELRVLAHISRDKNLIEAYGTDSDIHKITASKVFHTPLDEVTKTQRSNAKAVNFGIVYGISSFGLSQDLSITRKEANEYIKQYFITYPDIKKFLDNTVEEAKQKGYVTTMFGRRRPIPELSSSNFMQRSFGERIAMNSPIQGTAADIIKIAMIDVAKELRKRKLKSRIVLQIHDELLVETANDEIDIVREILSDKMSHAAKMDVNLVVDIGIGDNWLDAH